MKALGTWLGVIGWLSVLAWVAAHWIPSAYWMQVNKIYVSDADEGDPPKMTLDWRIHSAFAVRWTTVVKMALDTGDAEFQAVCESPGSRQLAPNMRLPKNMDLSWWIAPRTCALHRGDYYIETTFEWERLGIWYSQQVDSNVFHVPPP